MGWDEYFVIVFDYKLEGKHACKRYLVGLMFFVPPRVTLPVPFSFPLSIRNFLQHISVTSDYSNRKPVYRNREGVLFKSRRKSTYILSTLKPEGISAVSKKGQAPMFQLPAEAVIQVTQVFIQLFASFQDQLLLVKRISLVFRELSLVYV